MPEHCDMSTNIEYKYQGAMATQTIGEVSSPASVIQNNINTQAATIHDIFKIEGQTKNLHAHGSHVKATPIAPPKKEKYEIELHENIEGEQPKITKRASPIEITKPVFQHTKNNNVMLIE